MKKWNTPEQLLADFKQALELGINCQESGRLNLIEPVNKLGVGTMLFASRGEAKWEGASWSWQGRGWRHPKETAANGMYRYSPREGAPPISLESGQAQQSPGLVQDGADNGRVGRDYQPPARSVHIIESQDWDVDYYMPCLYKYVCTKAEWEKDFALNPGLAPAELGDRGRRICSLTAGKQPSRDLAEMLKIVEADQEALLGV